MRDQSGLSLTEILIAGSLGVLILFGIIKIYIAHHKTYQLEMGLARLQENGRMANYFFETDLHSAGYIGCANLSDIQVYPAAADFMADTSMQGFTKQQVESLPIPNNIKQSMRDQTDAIYIQKMDGVIANKVGADGLQISRDIHVHVNDNLIIADCNKAEIFTANKIVHQANAWYVMPQALLHYRYANHAQIGHWAKIVYYIAPAISSQGTASMNGYSLYRKDLNDNKNMATELIEGVEDMQVRYGVDTAGKGKVTQYLKSEKITNWAQVKSLRIALLLSSVDAILEKPEAYQFNDRVQQASDRIMRREWILYLTLYNR